MLPHARLILLQPTSGTAPGARLAMVLTCSILLNRKNHRSAFKGIPSDSGFESDALKDQVPHDATPAAALQFAVLGSGSFLPQEPRFA
jgi:hypothetical protein